MSFGDKGTDESQGPDERINKVIRNLYKVFEGEIQYISRQLIFKVAET